MPRPPWTILNYAFRTFFLLAGLFALLAIALWTAALHGASWPGAMPDRILWHAHEMLLGFAGAAIAGFLLTAVSAWTGRPQVCGRELGALAASWLAGRAGMLFAGALPAALVLPLDMAFPLLLAALAAREIVGGRSRRNYGIAALFAALAASNLLYHLGAAGLVPGAERPALTLILHLLVVLIGVIGGRIVPSFTANWLRMRGVAELPRLRPWLERAVIPLTLAAGLADTLASGTRVAGAVALAAAGSHALRLSGWRGPSTRGEALLAVLHVAYAWIAVGYALLGASALGLPLPRSAALHALSMGAVGNMILAVSTRVALGHTGRPLRAAPAIAVAYLVFGAAVLVRVASPLAGSVVRPMIDLAAAGWLATFGLFVWVYAPILTRPRADGRPERQASGSRA